MFKIALAGSCPAKTEFQLTLRDLLEQITRTFHGTHNDTDIFFLESPFYTDST